MIETDGWRIVFLVRMSPLLPAEVFNYACSVTPLTTYEYGLGCLGSIVPVAFWVIGAAQSSEMVRTSSDNTGRHSRKKDIILISMNVVCLGMLILVLYFAYRKYRIKMEEHIDKTIKDCDTPGAKQKLKRHVSSIHLSPSR